VPRPRGRPAALLAVAAACLLAARTPAAAQTADLAFPGGVLWQITFDAAPAHPPAFDEHSVYVVLRDGTVRAIDHATGLARWSAPAVSTVPASSSGTLLVGARGATAWALDAATGRETWARDLGAEPVAAPVAVPAGAAFLTGAADLVLLAWDDGREIWRARMPAAVTAPVAAGGERLWLGLEDGRVLAIRIADGTTAWARRVAARVLVITPIADRLLVGSDDNFLYAVKASDGGIAWRWRTGGDVAGPAVADGRRAYFASLDAMLRAVDLRHGDLRWQRPLATRAVGGPLLSGDVVIVAGVSPELRAFRTSDGGAADSAPVPGRALHGPVLAPARGATPARLLLLAAGGHLLAIGWTVEPRLVPLDPLPGVQLKPEVMPIIR
jgi:outer membrane protein assembly factor BamB